MKIHISTKSEEAELQTRIGFLKARIADIEERIVKVLYLRAHLPISSIQSNDLLDMQEELMAMKLILDKCLLELLN